VRKALLLPDPRTLLLLALGFADPEHQVLLPRRLALVSIHERSSEPPTRADWISPLQLPIPDRYKWKPWRLVGVWAKPRPCCAFLGPGAPQGESLVQPGNLANSVALEPAWH
jgi:hypothetical protein